MKTQTAVSLVAEVTIPLAVPVQVPSGDGRGAERSKIVMRRPKLRHAKRLAVVLGADLVGALMSGAPEYEAGADKAARLDRRAFIAELVPKLMSEDRLDVVTEVIADMCGEQKATIDDLDLLDLIAVGKGLLNFFPALRSLELTGSGPN
jgi:hypothetical protein